MVHIITILNQLDQIISQQICQTQIWVKSVGSLAIDVTNVRPNQTFEGRSASLYCILFANLTKILARANINKTAFKCISNILLAFPLLIEAVVCITAPLSDACT